MHWVLSRLYLVERGIGLAIAGVGLLMFLIAGDESVIGLAGMFTMMVGGAKFVAGPMTTTTADLSGPLALASLTPGASGGPALTLSNCVVGSFLVVLASLIVGIGAPSASTVEIVAWLTAGAGVLIAAVIGVVLLRDWLRARRDR